MAKAPSKPIEPTPEVSYPVILGSSFLNKETPQHHTMLCKKAKKKK